MTTTTHRPSAPRRPSAPTLLDPILTRVEILQRRRARIRPCRPGAVIGVAPRRHHGCPRLLVDGTQVADGDRIGGLHLYPARVREIVMREGEHAALREARRDLGALGRWADRQPPDTRPVAYCAEGIIVPLARRLGFEVRPSRRTPWAWVREWHFRWLLGHWSPVGRRRLARGHSRLQLAEAWLSARALRDAQDRAPGRAGHDREAGTPGQHAVGGGQQVGRGGTSHRPSPDEPGTAPWRPTPRVASALSVSRRRAR